MNTLAESVNTLPESINTLPECVNTLPESVNTLPECVNTLSECVNTLPESVNTLPECVNTLSESINTLPEFAANSEIGDSLVGKSSHLPELVTHSLGRVPLAVEGLNVSVHGRRSAGVSPGYQRMFGVLPGRGRDAHRR
jgi:hypothetical protein